ncbi:MAG: FUSC family protein [Oscillospiraceae bacterium]|nr:FUSC family protein [Oscillospiraceae bacterium]
MATRLQDELCSAERLSFDPASGVYTGNRSGYSLALIPAGSQMNLRVSVCKYGASADRAAFKALIKSCKPLKGCAVQGYGVTFSIAAGGTAAKQLERISTSIRAVTEYLAMNGYQNCCEACGRMEETSGCYVGGSVKLLCAEDYQNASQAVFRQAEEIAQKNENVIGGIVGALIGALIGAAVIVGIGQLGYVSMWSGVVMGVCAVKGYELLGGKLSTKGIVLSCVIMAIMVYLGHRMDWAITIAKVRGLELGEAFRETEQAVRLFGVSRNYYSNLALTFLFTAIGAVPTIITARKKYKAKQVAYKL